MLRLTLAMILAGSLLECSRCPDAGKAPPFGFAVGSETVVGSHRTSTCPAEGPDGVSVGIETVWPYTLRIVGIEVGSGCAVDFVFLAADGSELPLTRDGDAWVGSSPRSSGTVKIRPGPCDFDVVRCTLVIDRQAPGLGALRRTLPVRIDDDCRHDAEPEDPPDEPPIEEAPPDWTFEIPPEVLELMTIIAVADKEPGACVAVDPEGGESASLLRRGHEPADIRALITKVTTPFFREMGAMKVGKLARTEDRLLGAFVSDYPPLVAGDAPPPEGVSPYIQRRDLFLIDLPTGNTFRLTRHREQGETVAKASWSRQGDRIAYVVMDLADPLFAAELRVMGPVSGVSGHLTDGITGPVTWSPDDGTIAYVSDGDVWGIDPDGTNKRLLFTADAMQPSADQVLELDWHPTENRIACVVRSPGNIHGGRIHVFDLDTMGSTSVTDGRNDGLDPESTAEDRFAVWSPDGTRIAFIRTTEDGLYHEMLIRDLRESGPPDRVEGTHEYRDLDW